MDKRNIIYTVLYIFLRVIVRNGMFAKFICSTNGSLLCLRIKRLRVMWENRHGMFKDCRTLDDMVGLLNEIDLKLDDGSDMVERTEYFIMTVTNTLLHECIEAWGVEMDVICTMGQEIYETSCKRVLGNDFVDVMVGPPVGEMPTLDEMRIIKDVLRKRGLLIY